MKRLLAFTVLVAVGLIVAACAGSTGASRKLDVTMTDFSFTPAEYTVPAGQQVSIHLINNGAVEHSFVIMKTPVTGNEFTSADQANVYWEAKVAAGASSSETFTAPSDPGDYQVLCAEPGHYTAGMVAKMHVVSQ